MTKSISKSIYGKPRPNCTTLLFDLDETLIEVQDLCITTPDVTKPTKLTNNNTVHTLPVTRFPPHSTYFVDTSADCKNVGIVHLRPHLKPFLEFCFKHCNVAFWSTGCADYVKNIVSQLLHYVGKTTKDILFAWARTTHKKATDAKFVDVFTNEQIMYSKKQAVTYTSHKDFAYVQNRFATLSIEHTVLFDNLPAHQATNTHDGVLYLPPYSYLNVHDTVLVKLLKAMQQKLPTRSTTKNKSKTAQQPPLQLTKKDLNHICLVSPTNNNVVYPSGYIENETKQHYQPDDKLFHKNQHVMVHKDGEYVPAKMVKWNKTKRTATVCLLTCASSATKRRRNRKATTHKRPSTFDVADQDVVGMEYSEAYGLKT